MEQMVIVGSIFMDGNIETTSLISHVSIRYKYVNEYVEAWVVTNEFVKSGDNDHDILTKNLIRELHTKKEELLLWFLLQVCLNKPIYLTPLLWCLRKPK